MVARVQKKHHIALNPEDILLYLVRGPLQIPSYLTVILLFMARCKRAAPNQFMLAKKDKIKIGFGTGLYGSSEDFARQSQEFAFRGKWFTPIEILKQATSVNAEIIALCGKLNPYTAGPLGVIVPGAYADLLIIDGNPLKDIKLLCDPKRNLKLIMKDGKIYKNTL